MSKNRFELENDIMNVWAIKDQVSLLRWRMYDHPELLSEDNEHNYIMAVEYNIDLHCAKLMDTYCQVFQLNEYATAEMKARREQVLNNLTKKADKEDADKAWKEIYACKTPCGDIDCLESCANVAKVPSFPVKSKKAKKTVKTK
jgi:hypothetical protein